MIPRPWTVCERPEPTWIVRNHMNADGTLSGAKLINFVKNNSDTLKELYPHDQVSTFGALARNAEENMRWRTSTAVKGGSDSVKNYLAALDKVEKGNGHHVTVGLMATEALGFGLENMERIGWKEAGLAAIGAGTAYLANTLRQAGIRNTANLYREAMANPELARSLISKMPASADAGALQKLRPGAQAKPDRRADVDASGLAFAWPALRRIAVAVKTKARIGSVLNILLWDGQIELHQHAAAVAYAKLRRKAKGLGFARMRDAPAERARGPRGCTALGWL